MKSHSADPVRPPLKAVCFDYRGVILDHKTNQDLVLGMEQLLRKLKQKGLTLALVSRFPAEVVIERLGPLHQFFGSHVFSGGGEGKLACIKEFAKTCGIDDLASIAFVDDKPDNILPVAQGSDLFVIGFRGSGKYPQTQDICHEKGIPFADSVKALEGLLLSATDVKAWHQEE